MPHLIEKENHLLQTPKISNSTLLFMWRCGSATFVCLAATLPTKPKHVTNTLYNMLKKHIKFTKIDITHTTMFHNINTYNYFAQCESELSNCKEILILSVIIKLTVEFRPAGDHQFIKIDNIIRASLYLALQTDTRL